MKSNAEIIASWDRLRETPAKPKEKAQPPKFPVVWEPMKRDERYAAIELGGCRFGRNSWEKQFASAVRAQARGEDPQITPNQRYHLWRMIVKYRRQIWDESLVAKAKAIKIKIE